jgi:hypothetical protein
MLFLFMSLFSVAAPVFGEPVILRTLNCSHSDFVVQIKDTQTKVTWDDGDINNYFGSDVAVKLVRSVKNARNFYGQLGWSPEEDVELSRDQLSGGEFSGLARYEMDNSKDNDKNPVAFLLLRSVVNNKGKAARLYSYELDVLKSEESTEEVLFHSEGILKCAVK